MLHPPFVAPAAVSAFLKGVERRGLVLAQLQTGQPEQAERALAAAFRAFSTQAAELPMASWADRFWRLLASMPQLRRPGPLPRPSGWEDLADASGPRLALLLRLAAGLEEAPAAAAMAITLDAYRQALAEACPRDARQQPDAAAWRRLAEAIQQRVRQVDNGQLARLERLREAALAPGAVPTPVPATVEVTPAAGAVAPAAARRPSRGRWAWIVALLLAGGVAAVLASYWSHRPASGPGAVAQVDDPEGTGRLADSPAVAAEPLGDPPEPAPGAPGHADADMLDDPAGMALSAEADLLAWYAAGAPDAGSGPAESPEATSPDTAQDQTDASF